MAISVERLEALCEKPPQRIGLSATQRPLEEIGKFVSGAREITLVDAGTRKELDLEVVIPVDDLRELGQTVAYENPPEADGSALLTSTEGGTNSIWPSIYPEILRLVEEHRSTIVFVNNRRLAERLALRLNELANKDGDPDQPLRAIARAHHGSLAREQRQIVEEDLKAGRIPCLVATSSLELGIDMGAGRPRDPGRVSEVGGARATARRSRRPRHRRGLQRAHLSEVPRRPARVRRRRARDARGRHRGDEDPAQPARRACPADRCDFC